ncbi:MAG: SDR family oxidoreductase [Planctomycetales bacterium]|nr:SDR family oxidoreductase [Planctomycetales bacterium]
MRILILGATGMLGHKLCQLLSRDGFDVVGTVRRADDLRENFPGVFDDCRLVPDVDVLDDRRLDEVVRETDPQVIVNCVGIVKQLREAHNAYLSVALNAYLPHKLAKLCAEQGRRLIHISTDCVFDGTRGGYRETDESDARDLYGRSKFLGETTANETAAITLRTSIIGREIGSVTHGLLDWFFAEARAGRNVRGFARAIYTGFTTIELARVISLVVRDHPAMHGLYQVASPPINKFELLQLVRREFSLPIEIARDEAFVCDRSLVMDRFATETGYVSPSWERMIRELLEDGTPYDVWSAASK